MSLFYPPSNHAPTPLECYRLAVDYTFAHRWSGTKDGERSRDRALAFPLVDDGQGAEGPDLEGVFNRVVLGQGVLALKHRGLAPSTVNRHTAAYLTVWRTLYNAGQIPDPPPSGAYLKEPRGRERVVTGAEYVQLSATIGAPYRNLVALLWSTGCRVSEALGLRLEDCIPDPEGDGAAATITFRGTKNGDDRTVPWPSGVFVAPLPRTRITQASFNHEWARARRAMGLESDAGFVPHALRHTAITRWVAAGVPLPVVAKLAGHRSLKTTMRYTHLNTQNLVDALSRAGIL